MSCRICVSGSEGVQVAGELAVMVKWRGRQVWAASRSLWLMIYTHGLDWKIVGVAAKRAVLLESLIDLILI